MGDMVGTADPKTSRLSFFLGIAIALIIWYITAIACLPVSESGGPKHDACNSLANSFGYLYG